MNILKNKLLWIAPIGLLVVIMLLAVAFYPAYNPKPKNIPLAVVNLDKGTDMQGKHVNIGKDLTDNLLKNKSEAIEWKEVSSEKKAREGMDVEKYFGTVVLEKDFSKHALSKTQASVMKAKQQEMQDKVKSGEIPPEAAQQMAEKMKQSGSQDVKPESAQLKTIISQGVNLQGSQIATKVLDGLGQKVNAQITKQSLDILDKQDVAIPAKNIESLTQPVNVDNITVHKVKDHQANGNASFLMFMPVWMGSLITSVILFFAFRTSNLVSRKNRLIAALSQIVMTAVSALIGSFGYIYFMKDVLGFHFDHPNRVALYIMIAFMGFIGLVLGCMTWTGMKIVPVFFLLLFFSMQLLMLPEQMLPEFYRKYIVGWNPFSHYAHTLRDIIYMNQHIEMNATIWMFIGFMIFGIVSVIAASFVRKHSDKRAEIPA
ncbi:YhgE/Pip domain-containing protein [Staphylococcus carnosus]|uniref:ABC-2 type transporter transmembrane domain-containing protein n=3 Tax=Staphylococcus carnosus TaxID=1281 RepID=B9DJT1_STACT|nr:ABC transporter permease [Staphylococcus carnosus]QPT02858.1 ABC transporter permease [Staphylococcus carnosus]UQA67862.1 ABC transporter permease [Staphylococcus carnosus]UTB77317.1 phage infection protein [Staphylococcus carnosus]UTB86861.1 phage infection protein [Staphylococcus carnosus]UTB89211.1 phage infection protein [Staphylococcus carnosus]